jgi:mRNA interferase MazF
MPGFSHGDVVRVPFPYTDRSTRQSRPALVISAGGIGENAALLWVVMITSAENRGWPDDIQLGELYREAGLPSPSIIRPSKLATIEARHAELLGRLDSRLLSVVMLRVQLNLGKRQPTASALT